MSGSYFKEFKNCDELNEYTAENNVAVKKWQVVKLCTGDTVIVAEFESEVATVSKTILNENKHYEVKTIWVNM